MAFRLRADHHGQGHGHPGNRLYSAFSRCPALPLSEGIHLQQHHPAQPESSVKQDPSVDGLKTGFVAAAGYHLAATAQREGMRLLAVVMGAENPRAREREAMKLLNFGFHHHTLVQPFPPGTPVTTIQVWKPRRMKSACFPPRRPRL